MQALSQLSYGPKLCFRAQEPALRFHRISKSQPRSRRYRDHATIYQPVTTITRPDLGGENDQATEPS